MHITGIVAEYNPFHNGHLYQLSKTRELAGSDFVIAVMSGNFSQRGTPTIADKFLRTEMALSCGIDMVLELPTAFATSSAERFAEAAISLLNKTGIVDSLCFGSEIGEITSLTTIAKMLHNPPPAFSKSLKTYLKQGYSFPRARTQAAIDLLANTKLPGTSLCHLQELMSCPNNILGLEYLKALEKYNAPITPLTISRLNANYHDTAIHSSIASATAIRAHIENAHTEEIISCMPPASHALLLSQLAHVPVLEDLAPFLHYKLMFSQKEDLYALWDVPKELIHSILNCFKKQMSIQSITDAVTSKTYTRATVQRSILRILLNILSSDMKVLEDIDWIPYIRILGCKKTALPLIGALTQKAHVPIITNLAKSYPSLSATSKLLIDYELKATSLYHYLTKQSSLYEQDFTQAFIKK